MTRTRLPAAVVLAAILQLVAVTSAVANDPADGSVVLPDGRVLPPMPAEMLSEPSVHAEMAGSNPSTPATQPGNTTTAPLADPATVRVASAGGEEAGSVAAAAEVTSVAAVGPAGTLPNGLRKEVLGFLPYWMMDGSLSTLRYDLVSTIAYFGLTARSDGTLVRSGAGWTAWNSAAMTDVINRAHARGVRVVPVIEMFAWDGNYAPMSTLLRTATYRARLVADIVGQVRARGADGVNIDFEPVPTELRSYFTAFVREVKAGLVRAGVRSYVTVDTLAGAASWATGYDVVGLTASGAADALMVMAYDYSWPGSSRAGGVAPEESPYVFDNTDALAAHLALVPPGKLIWGIPYYGRTWPTKDASLNSLTCRSSTICPGARVFAPNSSFAWFYTGAKKHAATYGRRWDSVGKVPWYAWYDSPNATWQQGYYDDPTSLRAKYALVQNNRLAGIGIWSLLMDAGTPDLWGVIYDRFVKLDVRIGGADRYAGAANLSAFTFAPGVPLAVLATGENFPDALVGATVSRGAGPVLLTRSTFLPASTEAELARLRPGRIVVVGGPASVSDAVVARAARYAAGGATRISGADRYQGAANASASMHAPGVRVAYVASGENFPDALAGSPVATRDRMPLLLVRSGSVPTATAAELTRLRPGRIVVFGGPGTVGDAVLASLARYTAGGVTRITGADRYAGAANISRTYFGADVPANVYVATGTNFPDALAAAAVAARKEAPVLLVRPDSLPSATAAELRRLNPSRVIIVGGTGSVSDGVRNAIRSLWP